MPQNMEAIIQIINILIIIAFGIILLFRRFYLPSYLNKKGENLATKEDIAEITKRIEAVKIEFTSQAHILVKKRETYEKIISGMRIFIEGHPATEQDKNQMLEAYSMAWLWANDDVLKKLNYHLVLQIKKTSNPVSLKQDELKNSYTECILEMRKDSGYSDTDLERQDFHFVKF